MRLSVIVPATNDPPTLERCLESIRGAEEPPEEVIVVDDSAIGHAALARNSGVSEAGGDVLAFVDADVTVHPDVFVRIRRAFASDPELVALFGSYDDAPGARDVISEFRNLLHHHVHQNGGGPASTFWAGLGAIRREAFEAAGGFIVHPIEDIELGMRLSADGAKIVLDPAIQGKHLKRWSLWNMIRTDLFIRGIPWVDLLLEYRESASTSTLNLGWSHRLSALCSIGVLAGVLLWSPWVGASSLVSLIALNRSFYALLLAKQGPFRAPLGIGLHVIHLLTAVIAVPLGILRHYRDQSNGSGRPPAERL